MVDICAYLTEQQSRTSGKILYFRPLETGYGGQVSLRMLALKVGLVTDRTVVFPNVDDPPYLQTFLPQGPANAVDSRLNDVSYFIAGSDQSDEHALIFDYFKSSRLSSDQYSSIESWANDVLLARYDLPGKETLDGSVLEWMKMCPELVSKIQAVAVALDISTDVLGVHIRRGDKTVESPYVPLELFEDAARKIYDHWKYRGIFISSDNSKAIEDFSVVPGVAKIFDPSERRLDNANAKEVAANRAFAREETFTAAKVVYLLSECGGLVGQDNAHFATLTAARLVRRGTDPRRITLISGNIRLNDSMLLRVYYPVKLAARAILRRIIPNILVRGLYKIKASQRNEK